MTTADNQELAATALAEKGVHRLLGRVEEIDAIRLTSVLNECLQEPALVRHLSSQARQWTDGRGCARLVRYLFELKLVVRLATIQDGDRIYAWRNHPLVREQARNTDEIPYADHVRWFENALTDTRRILLIGEHGGVPVGCVRFDLHDQQAEISIFLDPELVGQGLGGRLLHAAESWLLDNHPEVVKILADVKMDNILSKKMFLGQGYQIERLLLHKELEKVA
jgi:RimJ/RimL family protein N-acetyltransferase